MTENSRTLVAPAVSKPLLLLIGLLCYMACGQALAAKMTDVPLNGMWTGAAYSNDETNKFSHCAATVSYRSGITMFVGVTRNFAWNLAFASDAWNLTANEQIPVSISFDGRPPWSGTGRALNQHGVVIPMADNSALISAFRGAYQMKVEFVGRTFGFNLDGTSRLMVELAQCVGTQLAIERGDPPPHYADVSTRPVNPPQSPTLSPATTGTSLELVATRIASNLLLQAKLPNARILSASEAPSSIRGRGVVWTSDAGIGAIELISAAAGKDPQQVASSLISGDATTCKGDFASGRSSDLVDDKVVTKAFTGCKDSAGSHAFRYFIVRGPAENFVVYELAGEGAAAPAQSSPMSDSTFQAVAVKAAYTP